MKSKISYLHMGSVPIYFGVAFTEKSFNSEMKRMDISDPPKWITDGADATMHTFERDNAMDTCIVCIDLKKKATKAQIAGLIIHEVQHVLQQIKMTMREDDMGRETEAYLVQHMSQFIISEARLLK